VRPEAEDVGAGADVFRFRPHDAEDRIRGWTSDVDRIDLRAFGFATRAEVLDRAGQAGDDVVIDLSDDRAEITLVDTDLATLHGRDFII